MALLLLLLLALLLFITLKTDTDNSECVCHHNFVITILWWWLLSYRILFFTRVMCVSRVFITFFLSSIFAFNSLNVFLLFVLT